MSKAVQQHLIGVTITFDPRLGFPIYTYGTLFGGAQPAVSLKVRTGDQVAWTVQVIDTDGTVSNPPYQLTFANSSVLGASSLSVPAGGMSAFVQAVSGLDGKASTKYTLAVQGVNPPDDPAVEIDNSGTMMILTAGGISIMSDGTAPAAIAPEIDYQVYWDSTQAAVVYGQGGAAPVTPFPGGGLSLKANDKVVFLVTPPALGFTINFDPRQQPLQLFNGELHYTIPSVGAAGSAYNQTVQQSVEYWPGQQFNFTFSAPGNNPPQSNVYFFTVQATS